MSEFIKAYLIVEYEDGDREEYHCVSESSDKFYDFKYVISSTKKLRGIFWKIVVDNPVQVKSVSATMNGVEKKIENILTYDNDFYLSKEVIYYLLTNEENNQDFTVEIHAWINRDIPFNVYKWYFESILNCSVDESDNKRLEKFEKIEKELSHLYERKECKYAGRYIDSKIGSG